MRSVNAAFADALSDPLKKPIYGVTMLGNLRAVAKSHIPGYSLKNPGAADLDLEDKTDYDSHFTASNSPGTQENRHGDDNATFDGSNGDRYSGSAFFTDNSDTGWTIGALFKFQGDGFRIYWEHDTVLGQFQIQLYVDTNGQVTVRMWNLYSDYAAVGIASGEERYFLAKWEDGVGLSFFLDGKKLTPSSTAGTVGVDDIWNGSGFANHVAYVNQESDVAAGDGETGRLKLFTRALSDAECVFLSRAEMIGITIDDVTGWPENGAFDIDGVVVSYSGIDSDFNLLKDFETGVMATDQDSIEAYGETITNTVIMTAGVIPGKDTDPAYHDVLSDVKTASQQITEAEGRSSMGTATFKIIDTDEFFTKAIDISGGAIRDKRVRIIVGFDTLLESEFEVDFVGYVQSNKLNNDLTSYIVTAGDVQRLMRGRVVLGSASLSGAITGTPTTITLTSTDRFDPTGGYVRIDDEIIAYGGVSGTTLTSITRAQFGTVSADHDDESAVKEIFEIQGHPIDIMLRFYMSTGDGTNGSYDVYPEYKGLGIDSDLFDLTSFENERNDFFPGTVFRFRIDETINEVKTWIESEILRPLSAHLKIRGDGTVALSVNRPALPAEAVLSFDKDNVDDYPSWDHNLRSVINNVTVNSNHDIITGSFLSQSIFIDAGSISNNGEARTFLIDQKGIHSELGGVEIIENLESLLRIRFGDPAPQVRVVSKVEQLLGEVGDIVYLSHPLIPDLSTGYRGINLRQFQVVRREADYINGKMTYTLTDTNRSGKYCVIAPDDSVDNPANPFPDYLGAGVADSQYAFIAGDDGKMSNGDDGCLII